MSIFRRKPTDDARELARALAQRGVAGQATVLALRDLGGRHGDGAREVELTLLVDLPDGGRVEVWHRQRLTRWTGHGVAPGEPVRVVYDAEDPHTLAVAGHARLRTAVRDGKIVALEVHDLGAAPKA